MEFTVLCGRAGYSINTSRLGTDDGVVAVSTSAGNLSFPPGT